MNALFLTQDFNSLQNVVAVNNSVRVHNFRHVSETPRLSDRSPGVYALLSWETPGDSLHSTTGVSETCLILLCQVSELSQK